MPLIPPQPIIAPPFAPPPPIIVDPIAAAAAAAAAISIDDGTPENQTLYIRNINERLKQSKVQSSLSAVFKQFGKIVDVYCWARSTRRKGQAWVVFDNIDSARAAKNAMQGFPFFNKPLVISFARQDSDVTAKRKGTWQGPRDHTAKKAREQELLAEQEKKVQLQQQQWNYGAPAAQAPSAADSSGEQPNNILFVTKLPDEVTEEMLQALFGQYTGFQEVRKVPGRGMAFVEYENELQATAAKEALQKFKVTPTYELHITFSKR